jgi:hypothetical protein
MKIAADEVLKTFKGLALAASRARELTDKYGKDELLRSLPRRQQDAIRQQLLEVEADIDAILKIMTNPKK